MEERIKNYADALYEQALHESGRTAREDQVSFQQEMAARGNTGNLPLGGTEIQGALRVKAAHIERCILSRLDSYQKTFEEIGTTPTDQDLTDILNELQAVQQLQVQHGAQALNSFLKTRGGQGDLTGSLRETSAHGYDRALQEWKSWRARVRLKRSAPVTETEGKARRVWVVHGRDERLRLAMFTFLRSIGLEPLEFSEARGLTHKSSPYVGEILDAAFEHAQAVVVLLTPDDQARLRPDLVLASDQNWEKELTGQARPNVLFEAGMAFSRHPSHTVLVQVGVLRPFSDVAGRHVVNMDGSPQKRQDIAARLKTAGCPVNLDGTDWHSAGDFTLSVPPKSAIPASSSALKPNLVLGDIWYRKLYLLGDIWSKNVPQELPSTPQYEAIFADIKNAFKSGEPVGAAFQIKAELIVNDSARHEEFSSLPWLDHYFNRVNFQPGDVKRVLLAVGMETRQRQLGDWRVVLNHRDDESLGSGVSAMDFDCSLKRVPKAKIALNLVSIKTGEIVNSFKGACIWKAGYGRPEIIFSDSRQES